MKISMQQKIQALMALPIIGTIAIASPAWAQSSDADSRYSQQSGQYNQTTNQNQNQYQDNQVDLQLERTQRDLDALNRETQRLRQQGISQQQIDERRSQLETQRDRLERHREFLQRTTRSSQADSQRQQYGQNQDWSQQRQQYGENQDWSQQRQQYGQNQDWSQQRQQYGQNQDWDQQRQQRQGRFNNSANMYSGGDSAMSSDKQTTQRLQQVGLSKSQIMELKSNDFDSSEVQQAVQKELQAQGIDRDQARQRAQQVARGLEQERQNSQRLGQSQMNQRQYGQDQSYGSQDRSQTQFRTQSQTQIMTELRTSGVSESKIRELQRDNFEIDDVEEAVEEALTEAGHGEDFAEERAEAIAQRIEASRNDQQRERRAQGQQREWFEHDPQQAWSDSDRDWQQSDRSERYEDLEGIQVRSSDNEEVGKIKRVNLDASGNIESITVSVSRGWWDFTSDDVIVPVSAVQFQGDDRAVVSLSQERIFQLAEQAKDQDGQVRASVERDVEYRGQSSGIYQSQQDRDRYQASQRQQQQQYRSDSNWQQDDERDWQQRQSGQQSMKSGTIRSIQQHRDGSSQQQSTLLTVELENGQTQLLLLEGSNRNGLNLAAGQEISFRAEGQTRLSDGQQVQRIRSIESNNSSYQLRGSGDESQWRQSD